MGFGLVIGCIGLFKLVTTIHYSTITDSHTTACTKSSQLCCVFTGCRLLMALNIVVSSASMFHNSGPCWLAPISQQPYSFLSRAIPHALMAHRLHSLTTDSRLSACRPMHSLKTPKSLANCLTRLDSSQVFTSVAWQRLSMVDIILPLGLRPQAGDHVTPTSACWLQLALSFSC
jgi:hypothetical protein